MVEWITAVGFIERDTTDLISIVMNCAQYRPSSPSALAALVRVPDSHRDLGRPRFLALQHLMWVAPEARGLSLGRRLLHELERHAKENGARVVRLETNRALKVAIQLCRRAGHREVARFNEVPYAHHWFEKRLKAR